MGIRWDNIKLIFAPHLHWFFASTDGPNLLSVK